MPRKKAEPKYVILYTRPRQPVAERIYLRSTDSWTNNIDHALKGTYESMVRTLEMIKSHHPDARIEEAPLLESFD